MKKSEIWEKYEILDLFQDLEQAEEILSKLSGGYSRNFNSVEDFRKAFVEELYDLKGENVPDFRQICLWFAPTSVWDDFVGTDGMELANRIYERAERWNKDTIKPVTESNLASTELKTIRSSFFRIFDFIKNTPKLP